MRLTGLTGHINGVKLQRIIDRLVFQNVAVSRMNRVVTLTEVSCKIMYQRFAATK